MNKHQLNVMQNYQINFEVMRVLKREKEQMKVDIINQLFGLMLMSVHDEFGWFSSEKFGKKRIDRLVDRFNSNFDAIEKGYLKLPIH